LSEGGFDRAGSILDAYHRFPDMRDALQMDELKARLADPNNIDKEYETFLRVAIEKGHIRPWDAKWRSPAAPIRAVSVPAR
jgi:hypothetical protein